DLHALASKHDEISEPAAQQLAITGDAALLVARLAAIESHTVRRQLRAGLVRRGGFPARELEAALRGDNERARHEAAWMAGASGDRTLAAAAGAAVDRAAPGWDDARKAAGAKQDDRVPLAGQSWRASLWAA